MNLTEPRLLTDLMAETGKDAGTILAIRDLGYSGVTGLCWRLSAPKVVQPEYVKVSKSDQE